MCAGPDSFSSKEKVRRGFQDAHPSDLSISEVAAKVGVSINTASTYIKVLVAEGFLEQSRPICMGAVAMLIVILASAVKPRKKKDAKNQHNQVSDPA
jgi:DNA-binding IclR family transcriptional regulator